MKKILMVALLLACSSANAAIITYSWDHHLVRAPSSNDDLPPIEVSFFDASGTFIFDSATRSLIGAQITSEPVNFDWAGSVPIDYEAPPLPYSPYPVAALFKLDVENYHLALFFDTIYVEAGEDFFLKFDQPPLDEGAQVDAYEMYGGQLRDVPYLMRGHLELESIVEPSSVTEPSVLALFALGLFCLAGANSRRAK